MNETNETIELDAGGEALAEAPETPEILEIPVLSEDEGESIIEGESMRAELSELRAELARRDAEAAERDAAAAERALLEELFPGVKREEIPQCVYEEAAARGIPLAAALAMQRRRSERERELAEASNELNRRRTSGRVAQSEAISARFTLEEIRAMTPAQVKRHYKQIIASLGGQ